MGNYNSREPVTRDGMNQQEQVDVSGSYYSNNEGRKPTYRSIASGVVVTANGVFFSLQGAASKILRVTRIYVAGQLTTAAGIVIQANRCTAAVTGAAGTVAITPRPLDSRDAAAVGLANSYTSATIGAGVVVASGRPLFPTASTVGAPFEMLFGGRNSRSLVLKDATEFLQVSVTAGSYAGALFDIDVEHTEEPIVGA